MYSSVLPETFLTLNQHIAEEILVHRNETFVCKYILLRFEKNVLNYHVSCFSVACYVYVFNLPLAVIALKSGWQVEVSEKGAVRLWLQTESLSNSAELRLIFNDREISSTPVRTTAQIILQLRKYEHVSLRN